MAIKTTLESNGYTFLSEEYKTLETTMHLIYSDFFTLGYQVKGVNQKVYDRLVTRLNSVVNQDIKATLGDYDLNDLTYHLTFADSKSLATKKIIKKVCSKREFNPIHYTTDKKGIKKELDWLVACPSSI